MCVAKFDQTQLPQKVPQSNFLKFNLQLYGLCLCVCNLGSYADNLVDTVDRLLIYILKRTTTDLNVTKLSFVSCEGVLLAHSDTGIRACKIMNKGKGLQRSNLRLPVIMNKIRLDGILAQSINQYQYALLVNMQDTYIATTHRSRKKGKKLVC